MGRFTALPTITDDSALGGSTIVRSLRFDRNDNHYLTRTPSSAGNRKTWTYSTWVKLGQTGTNTSNDPGNGLFLSCGPGSTAGNMSLRITNNGYVGIDYYGIGGYYSSNRLRDLTSWYHCVWVMDTTESTAANRMKVYVNGDLFYNNSMSLSQNADTPINNNSATTIGCYSYNTSHAYRLDGYLSEINFIDGLALDPSYFGYTEFQTGIWRPKKYIFGNYGTNGFHLDFSDNSSTTAATLGKDTSGNGNNFTPSNYGASLVDDVLDTPTNNFCTLNPLRRQNDNCTLTDGNLKATGPNESYPGATGTIALSSGKWYYEFVINSRGGTGGNPLCGISQNDYVGGGPDRICYTAGGVYISATPTEPSDPASFAVNDVIGVAIDLDDAAGKIRFYKNGTLQPVLAILNSVKSDLQVSLKGGVFPYVQMYNGDVCTVNFGQRPFSHTPPSGHRKITSNNLLNHSTTSILDPKKHFGSLLYTGDDKNYRNVIGLDFTPDFLWLKNRDHTAWHNLANSMTGFQNHHYSNSTLYASYDLNSNGYINPIPIRGENGQGGFSVNAQSDRNTNNQDDKHVAWCWKGGSPNIETPSSGSVYFPESNNYLDLGSYTDFQFGTGDYTIEMFVYHTLLSGQHTYVGDNYGNSAGVYFYKDSNNKLGMYYSSQIATGSADIPLRKWTHIAASRSSGTLKLFQDGIEVGSGSDSTNLTETQLNIGDTTGGSSGSMHGYISNVRILKGTGLYTSNFTPPTSPLTNISNTVFLGCQSETVAGLASVHPSPFSNNGTNYSSGSQMSGDILAYSAQYGAGGKDALFDGRIGQYSHDVHVSSTLSADSQITWTPTSSISYSSKLEVWCYSPNGYGITVYYTLNGGSEQTMPVGGGSNFNNSTWITLATGSGTITSIKIRLTRSGADSFVNWGAIRVDGSILVNDVTGKVVTPTMDDTRSVPPSNKNPFDGEFAIDGTRYLTAAAAGLNGGTLTPIASSINTKAGFSMLMYNGNGTSGASISHGLREAPKIFFIKSLEQSRNWYTLTTAKDGSVDYFYLNLTNTLGNSAASAPTSDLIYYTSSQESNNNNEQYILYAFHDVPGYCKIGSYTSNGSSNGIYVNLGFKPALVIFKNASSSEAWSMFDNKRDPHNPVAKFLRPSAANTDTSGSNDIDFLSNGFKTRTSNNPNSSGATYIYMAFAESSGNTPYQTETTAR